MNLTFLDSIVYDFDCYVCHEIKRIRILRVEIFFQIIETNWGPHNTVRKQKGNYVTNYSKITFSVQNLMSFKIVGRDLIERGKISLVNFSIRCSVKGQSRLTAQIT